MLRPRSMHRLTVRTSPALDPQGRGINTFKIPLDETMTPKPAAAALRTPLRFVPRELLLLRK